MTLDDWSISFVSASLSVLRRTLNPYTSARDCKMKLGGFSRFFSLFNGQQRFQVSASLGELSNLAPGQTLHLSRHVCFQRWEYLSLFLSYSLSQKKRKEYASRGPWSLSTRDSGNARMVNLPNPHDTDPLWYDNWLRGVVYHRAPLTSTLSYTPKLPITYLAHIRF